MILGEIALRLQAAGAAAEQGPHEHQQPIAAQQGRDGDDLSPDAGA